MTKGNKNGRLKWLRQLSIYTLTAILAFALIAAAFAEETELTKIGSIPKEEISQDSNQALKEYYGSIFGLGEDTSFNNMAVKENIAILNVTIDGKDRRILTKLASGFIMPKIAEELLAATIKANNLTVLENLKILGNFIFSRKTSYGDRNFYAGESTIPAYIDEGFSRLKDGSSNVSVNPALRDMISGYSVYLSAEGMTKGLYVAEKSDSYFVVKSANPKSKIKFSWMLRGAKKDAAGKLESQYGKSIGIEIKAQLNYENESAKVKIKGLAKIRNITNASSAGDNDTNTTANTGLGLLTGNIIDEFGLETDLGSILSNTSSLNLSEKNSSDETLINYSNETNSSDIENEIPEATENEDGLEFTVYSTDESYIVQQIASVTGLDEETARKLVTFSYDEPTGFEDETIEPEAGKIDGIERINGSVIIRLG